MECSNRYIMLDIALVLVILRYWYQSSFWLNFYKNMSCVSIFVEKKGRIQKMHMENICIYLQSYILHILWEQEKCEYIVLCNVMCNVLCNVLCNVMCSVFVTLKGWIVLWCCYTANNFNNCLKIIFLVK